MNRLLFSCLIVAASSAWPPAPVSAQSIESIEPASFMEGCWVQARGGVRSEEIWMAPSGGVMVGMSRVVPAGRPASWEFLVLHVVDGNLTFSASPSGQEPADFTRAAAKEPAIRFENRIHDFPQAIEYRPEGPDAMQARVFGAYQDAEPAFVVAFDRTRCPGSNL